MKKLDIVIMAHKSRECHFSYLAEKLNNPKFSIDDGSLGIWGNCRRAWQMIDKSAEYGAVIQDDAIIASDFFAKAERYLTSDAVYSFYVGRLRYIKFVKNAFEKRMDRFATKHIANEVALCMKTSRIDDMVDFCDKAGATSDRWINNWTKARKLLIVYTMPSLVDHRDHKTLHQLNAGKYRRVATWFDGDIKKLRSHKL